MTEEREDVDFVLAVWLGIVIVVPFWTLLWLMVR